MSEQHVPLLLLAVKRAVRVWAGSSAADKTGAWEAVAGLFEVLRSMLVTKHLAGVAVEVEYCFCAVHLACGRSCT